MPVQADAVDSAIGPVRSFLPPGPNIVAQALLSDPGLRGQTPLELSRTLHVPVPDAQQAIGAILGMINRTALGNAQSALEVEPSLANAIGPEMSLDRAMSRFGSHMGPIVRRPSPSPLWRPDVGEDRQYGAGGLTGGEAGAVPQDLIDAAANMKTFLEIEGCGVSPAGVVRRFQELFNANHSPAIATDDHYGPETMGALDQVIADADADQPGTFQTTAPPACHAAHVSPAPPPPPGPKPTPSHTPVAPLQASIFGSGWTWATALVVAGAVLIARSKHPPKWARQIGLARHAR